MADASAARPGWQVIEIYAAGNFQISGVTYQTSVIVQPAFTLSWPVTAAADLQVVDFSPLVEAEPRPDIVLLGCGNRTALIPSGLRQELRTSGLVLDAMDTPAACRTFNILVAEGRRVAAALIAIV